MLFDLFLKVDTMCKPSLQSRWQVKKIQNKSGSYYRPVHQWASYIKSFMWEYLSWFMIIPFIHLLSITTFPWQGRKGLEPVPADIERGQGTSWTSRQFISGLTYRDTLSHSYLFLMSPTSTFGVSCLMWEVFVPKTVRHTQMNRRMSVYQHCARQRVFVRAERSSELAVSSHQLHCNLLPKYYLAKLFVMISTWKPPQLCKGFSLLVLVHVKWQHFFVLLIHGNILS